MAASPPSEPQASAHLCRGGSGMIHGEPALEEVLNEPIVLLLARRDGLSAEDLRVMIESIRRRLDGARHSPPASP